MEFYIKEVNDANYDDDLFQVDEDIAMLLTQIETLLFTPKRTVLGYPSFGLSLEDYVYSFTYNDIMLKNIVETAIFNFIPLASSFSIDVNVEFLPRVEINMVIIDITINNRFGISLTI